VSALEDGDAVEVTYVGRLLRVAPRVAPRIALVRLSDGSTKYVPLNDTVFTIARQEEGMRAAILDYLDAVDARASDDLPADDSALRASVGRA
jgi:hypothetical protein